MMLHPCYIQVILPLRLGWEPFYIAGPDAYPGQRVRVNFSGKNYIGVVHRTGVVPDLEENRIKRILGPAEGYDDISPRELELWEFTAEYYLCTIGEVYKTAYPIQKLEAEGAGAREIQRLRTRLEKIDSELERRSMSKRASSEVTDRLAAEQDRLLAQLACLKEEAKEGARTASPEKAKGPGRKPVLLVSEDRTGKYMAEIRKTLAEGRSVLVLAPDIIFCEKLEDRIAPVFPQLLTYNSKKTKAAQKRVVEAVRNNCSLVLGTRSAIFLPFNDLGLIIVDNEQDSSFKQEEPAPRYNGRDLAIILARIHGAGIVLGTSTPSLESTINCRSGKFILEKENASECKRTIQVIDIPEEKRKNGMVGLFSRKLIDEINSTEGKVALIRSWEKPEEVKELTDALFPSRAISIMTMAEARRGTLKDFALTAVLQADAFMSKDEFRSDERMLHTLKSLSEICGGQLFIQSANGGHRVYQAAVANSVEFTESILKERKDFDLPPFTRLVDVVFNDDNGARLAKLSSEMMRQLRKDFRISGMMDGRMRISFSRDAGLAEKKTALMRAVDEFIEKRNYGQHVHLDADPN